MNVDAIILTVIPAELTAVRTALGIKDLPTKLSSGTNVWQGPIRSSRFERTYRVALACIGHAGNPDAAAATTELILSCSPKVAFLVGIAAGIRGKTKIGQVVLSERVVAYEPAALEPGREVPRPEIVRAARAIEQDITAYLGDAKRKTRLDRVFSTKLARRLPQPPPGQESEYAENVTSSLSAGWSTIASGEKLLRDPSKLLALRQTHGKVEVGEMEAAGFMTACSQQGIPWLVVRGISDFGDALKNDMFHTFASETASAILVDFLKYGLHLTPSPEQAQRLNERRFQKAEARYRQLALEACDIVDLAGLPEDAQVAKQDLVLRELYIPLRVRAEGEQIDDDQEAETSALATATLPRSRKDVGDGRIAIGHLLKKAPRIVVLADPGGGKSTLVRWLATAYLLRLKRDPALARLPDLASLPDDDLLPIVIRCRDLDDACASGSLDDMLHRTLRKSELSSEESEVLGGVLRQRLTDGSALLLIDGLDEIPTAGARGSFCKQLERIVLAYPKAPVIVTSRIVGYREMGFRLGREFIHTQITDLTAADKNAFARRWCALTEPADRRAKKIEELIEGIHGSDRIERLTGNPMMLTTLALVKRKVGRLPHRRAELYQEAVQVLLHWRSDVDEPLEKAEALPQLEYVAWEMCRRGVQRLNEHEVLHLLERIREDFPNVRPVRNHSPEDFLRVLERRTSILVQMGTTRVDGEMVPVYEFRHLTFQEYLAGVALVRSRYPAKERPKSLADRVGPLAGEAVMGAQGRRVPTSEVGEHWTEAIRLCVASCNDDDVDDVLRAIASPGDTEDPARVARGRAILAALCLADEPNVSDAVAGEVLDNLVSVVGTDDGHGPIKTGIDSAVVQLASSFWASALQERLLTRFLFGDPDEGMRFGGLYALVSRGGPTGDVRETDTWLTYQSGHLKQQGGREAVGTALMIMDYLYHSNVRRAVPDDLVDTLIAMLKGDQWQQYSAGWCLMWVFVPRKQPKGSPRRLRNDQVTAIVAAATQTFSGAQFLAQLANDDWHPEFEPILRIWLKHESPDARRRSVTALGSHAGTASLPALRESFQDSDPSVAVGALEAVVSIAKPPRYAVQALSKNLDGESPFIHPNALTSDRLRLAAEQASVEVGLVEEELLKLGLRPLSSAE